MSRTARLTSRSTICGCLRRSSRISRSRLRGRTCSDRDPIARGLRTGIICAIFEAGHRVQLPDGITPAFGRLVCQGAIICRLVVFAIYQQLSDDANFVAERGFEIRESPGSRVELCAVVRSHLDNHAILLQRGGWLRGSRRVNLARQSLVEADSNVKVNVGDAL